MTIEGLTFEELESLVASAQCDPGDPEESYYDSRLQEIFDDTINVQLTDREGEFTIANYGNHILLEEIDEVWFTVAEHIGIVRGRCDSLCRGMRADVKVRNALPATVVFEGQTWTLEGDPNYGAPMYVAEIGWVVRRPYFENDDDGRWQAGANGGYAEFGGYPTMEKAMRAAKRGEIKIRRNERRCIECGQLKRK